MVWSYSHALRGTPVYEDIHLWGVESAMFGRHAISIGVHFLNGIMLFLLASRLATPLRAWMATTLFWLHPIQAEAVAYVVASNELLAGYGILLVLMGASLSRPRWWAVSVVTFGGCVAFAAKPSTAASLFLWLPLLAWQTKRSHLLWAGLVWSGVGYLVATPILASHAYLAPVSWMARQAAAVWHLARLLVWPVGLSLETPPAHWPWLALVAFVGVVMVAIPLPRWRFAGLWATAAFVPRMVLAQPKPILPEPLHEHHVYAAMIGLCLGWAVPTWRDQ